MNDAAQPDHGPVLTVSGIMDAMGEIRPKLDLINRSIDALPQRERDAVRVLVGLAKPRPKKGEKQ